MEEKADKKLMRTRYERKNMGRDLRQVVPLSSQSQWTPAADRPDPVSLLKGQDEGRIDKLIPIRYGRMLDSPFTFFRGSAILMATDLVNTPATGIEAILCGDAHLSNFGVFATPERRMVFDVNDFDEAFFGPWEWDLKRLAASGVIAGRDNGFSEETCRQLAEETARAYSQALVLFADMRTIDQWYYHINADAVLKVFEESSKKGRKSAAKMVKKAAHHTHERTLEKMTEIVNEQRRIIADPPLLVPVHEMDLESLLSKSDLNRFTQNGIENSWQEYLVSLPFERRFLLERYEIIDMALRVGGIGSVGTRCFVMLLKGGADDDSLILQLKEAGPSVLEAYVSRKSAFDNHAHRVVVAQHLMQATSDIFLGWCVGEITGVDYYWRQLKDMKGSVDIGNMDESGLEKYLAICSHCLARAHARTGDEIKIQGYVGNKEYFIKAIGEFSMVYADQVERDYERLNKAVKAGDIPVEKGI
jgi:uncharacterized protein (DUF2252 family)